MSNQQRVRLTFPEELIKQAIIGRLVREFDVMPNIRQAKIEETVGWVVCELSGEARSLDAAIAWLREIGVDVESLGDIVEG